MKDKTKVRSEVIVTNVTVREADEIRKAAGKMNLSVSSFMRSVALLMARKFINN